MPRMRRNPLEIVGQQFDRLFVLNIYKGPKESMAYCICECGNTKATRLSSLRRGCTRSCGCLNLENTRKKGLNNAKHGHSRRVGTGRSRAYKTWCSILRRCYTPSASGYYKYGAKGVTVCDTWRNSFEDFLNDMGEPPTGLSIDRIDNSKGYSKENCRWITNKEQANNKTTNLFFTINSETKTLAQWVEIYKPQYGLSYATVQARIYRGLGIEDALTRKKNS